MTGHRFLALCIDVSIRYDLVTFVYPGHCKACLGTSVLLRALSFIMNFTTEFYVKKLFKTCQILRFAKCRKNLSRRASIFGTELWSCFSASFVNSLGGKPMQMVLVTAQASYRSCMIICMWVRVGGTADSCPCPGSTGYPGVISGWRGVIGLVLQQVPVLAVGKILI